MILTCLTVYVVSLLITRHCIKRDRDEGVQAFFACVVPLVNSIVALAFVIFWIIDYSEGSMVKVANWFFNKK